ncbi:unnamed protein product [Adineta steineri]|uniref:Uncharacterized protein n=1 Tax=Adineta steineri TaxID=433720 RepID=A0A814C2E6_9BILA|nr:unnamed protein product [Adineta steineri]CAF4198223.1 unnamed protein product [Adineta steineri]
MSATITYSPTTTVMSDPTNDQSSGSPPFTLIKNAHYLNQKQSQSQLRLTSSNKAHDSNQEQPQRQLILTIDENTHDLNQKPSQRQLVSTISKNTHDSNQEQPQRQLISTNNNHDEIESYMCWSIFSILFCGVGLGCIACCFSLKVGHLFEQGDTQGALRASKDARTMNILATLFGIIIIIICILYLTGVI